MIRASVFSIVALLVFSATSDARTFRAAKGDYVIRGDAIAFSADTVVIKRSGSERLVAVEVKDLSEEDQRFLKVRMKQLDRPADSPSSEWQTWTSHKGWKIRAKVLSFGRSDMVVDRQRGITTINGRAYSKLPPLYQKLSLSILSKLSGVDMEEERDLNRWASGLNGQPQSFALEGVLMQLETGDKLPVPFFLFSDADQKALHPGWESWKAAMEDDAAQQREDFLVRQEALQYQAMQQREAQYQQMEVLKLNLLGVTAGVTSIWEVALYPNPGVWGRPMSVVVSARDSLTASNMALRQYPGYRVGPVRRVSR